MNDQIDKYEQQAATIFSKLLTIFEGWGNGWQVGNVFDTLTDYVLRYPDAKGAVVDIASKRWDSVQGSMCWYDDWGWWGIASVKAFDSDFKQIFGSHLIEFQNRANDCWKVMYTGKPDKNSYRYKGGPNVWENRDDGTQRDYFTSPDGWAVPRFSKGVWQYDMWQGKRTGPPECTPNHEPDDESIKLSDPKSEHCPLGPYQLTVMNGLYLELALRLAMEGQGGGATLAIKSELEFLNNWFDLDGDDSLLQKFSDNSLLVRERVATYASMDGDKTYPAVENYEPKDAWCGDQGLLLGGLLDYVQLANPSDPTPQSQAISIAMGVLLHMVDADGIVMPYNVGFNNHNDPGDYSCGSGVFWRYLLRGFNQNAKLQAEVLALITENPDTNPIVMSAANPYAYAPFDNDLFKEFNALSVLLTATEILKQASVGS